MTAAPSKAAAAREAAWAAMCERLRERKRYACFNARIGVHVPRRPNKTQWIADVYPDYGVLGTPPHGENPAAWLPKGERVGTLVYLGDPRDASYDELRRDILALLERRTCKACDGTGYDWRGNPCPHGGDDDQA